MIQARIVFLTLAGTLAFVALLGAGSEEERIRARVRAIRASDTDAWRRIPWAPSLLDAAHAARLEGRPLFVFSHEGNIDTGRC